MKIVFTLLTFVAMCGTGVLASAQTGETEVPYAGKEDTVRINTAVVFSINDIEVPAMVKGFIKELNVEEGDYIEANKIITQLDVRSITNELESARIRLANAERQSKDNTPVDYAQASFEVAKSEYQRELGLSRKGSSTPQELERKQLAMRQAELQYDRSVEQKAIDGGAVKLEDQAVAQVQDLLDRHSIRAPFSGEIVKISNRVGEYVQEGETVVRLVDSSRVKVEGRVNSSRFNEHELRGKPVTVTLQLARGETRTFEGNIKSIGLERQIGRDGSVFVVQAIVKNQKIGNQWLLHPKATVSMDIRLRDAGQ